LTTAGSVAHLSLSTAFRSLAMFLSASKFKMLKRFSRKVSFWVRN
jgi:hypothetical protein